MATAAMMKKCADILRSDDERRYVIVSAPGKRFKDDQKEVAEGYECGITLERYSDIKESAILEAFIVEEYRD